ncbi:hypothetical protein K7X08_018948 [Anisodus acutangulus]|uniref:Uncharacterized protein n=1 Tax=Anisodus acutangulus TaxID=402998 RepID=A0A9Q1LZG6_9SOLA|nr:hypothetical protein K7X08_018948 [Anisodus acutangulus]
MYQFASGGFNPSVCIAASIYVGVGIGLGPVAWNACGAEAQVGLLAVQTHHCFGTHWTDGNNWASKAAGRPTVQGKLRVENRGCWATGPAPLPGGLWLGPVGLRPTAIVVASPTTIGTTTIATVIYAIIFTIILTSTVSTVLS